MPRGVFERKKKVEKPIENEGEADKLAELVGSLSILVHKLEERVTLLEVLPVKETQILHVDSPQSTFAPIQSLPSSTHPVPLEYRQIVDSVLNGSFGINVEGRSDIPAFTFTVVVPEKYSTATKEQLNMIGGYDIRPKTLNYADGTNGVREWSEKVFNSFSAEIKAQIVADRSQLVHA